MDFPHGETVVVLTGAAVDDPYSGESTVIDWSEPTEVEVRGCAVAPRTSSEPTQDARTAVITGMTVYLPPGTVITPQSRLRVRGELHEVDGEAGVWISPFTGWTPGVEVATKRVAG